MMSSQTARRGTTEVSLVLAFFFSAPLYGGILASKEKLPDAFRVVLFERGWVQHATLILTCLALAILVVKAFGLLAQKRAFKLDVVPADQTEITKESLPTLIERAQALFRRSSIPGVTKSFLVARVLGLLQAHAFHPDAKETGAVNGKASDADHDAVSSSYSMVKVLVWAIPIVGFIGTVVGIGDAVVGFSESLKHADQLDAIKGSLAKVTLGLSVAFDTTLLSLVTSILVMLPMTYLQKTEERVVRDVDDYATALLRRIPIAEPGKEEKRAEAPPRPIEPEEVKRWIAESIAPVLADMVRAHTALLEKMSADVTALSGAVSGLAPAIERAVGGVAPAIERTVGGLTPSLERAVGTLEEATRAAERANGQASKAEDQLCREIGASRQLLQLLASGLRDDGAPSVKPKGVNGANGKSGTAPRET